MKTIFVQFGKGGSSKTSTTFLLAVELLNQKHAVGVVDLDPQQSLTRKMEERGDIPCLQSTFTNLEKVIEKGKSVGLDYLIVDTPPHSGVQFLTISDYADLIIAPVNRFVISDKSFTNDVKKVLPKTKTVLLLNDIKKDKQQLALDYLREHASEYPILKSRIFSSDAIANRYDVASSPSDMGAWVYNSSKSQLKAFGKEVVKWLNK